ncbi:MAG: hypothetical protein QNK04_22250 [Myxococcota bacterium]|nr:hypothetical protein [Myxococcota bacterium]
MQSQIGGGLPLPIQVTDADGDNVVDWGAEPTTGIMVGSIPLTFNELTPTPVTTRGPGRSVFPPLLVPRAPGATIMTDGAGGLTIAPGVLSRPPGLTTVGVASQNPTLHAVATNLGFKWPKFSAMLSARSMTATLLPGPTHTFPSNATTQYLRASPFVGTAMIRYVNPGAGNMPFGGVARLAVSPVLGSGVKTSVAVTVFAVAGTPPNCAAPCPALLLPAFPAATGAAGGRAGTPVLTPGGAVAPPNIYAVINGTPAVTPKGTIMTVVGPVGTFPTPPTNAAMSVGFPWTTGRITVSAPGAKGTPERFVLSGADNRTANGAGTIQLVSGALSQRATSGPNGNRSWVRLDLTVPATPSLSTGGLAVLTGTLLAAAVFAMARRRARV